MQNQVSQATIILSESVFQMFTNYLSAQESTHRAQEMIGSAILPGTCEHFEVKPNKIIADAYATIRKLVTDSHTAVAATEVPSEMWSSIYTAIYHARQDIRHTYTDEKYNTFTAVLDIITRISWKMMSEEHK